MPLRISAYTPPPRARCERGHAAHLEGGRGAYDRLSVVVVVVVRRRPLVLILLLVLLLVEHLEERGRAERGARAPP